MSLTTQEKKLLEQVSQFHNDYGDYLAEAGKNSYVEAVSTEELVQWHKSVSSAIISLLELEKEVPAEQVL